MLSAMNVAMCGRYTLTRDDLRFAKRLGLDVLPPLVLRYNIAPTQDAPVIISDQSGRRMKLMRWGLVPHWADDISAGARAINARAETVSEKPMFRHSFRRRRCLVPADSFYEWRKTGRLKQPVRIQMKSREPFAFAGLWDHWQGPDERDLESFTIITTEANTLLAGVHDRMPVILPDDAIETWLNANTNAMELRQLLKPFSSEAMDYYEVNPVVNDVRNEGPQCIEPLRASESAGSQQTLELSFETKL